MGEWAAAREISDISWDLCRSPGITAHLPIRPTYKTRAAAVKFTAAALVLYML